MSDAENAGFRRFLGSVYSPFSTWKIIFSRKNQVPVPKMLSRRGSGKWHGKWKENGEKSKRFRDAENVSRIALCEEFTTFVTSENVVKSMPKRRGKVIENGRKSIILAPRGGPLAFSSDFGWCQKRCGNRYEKRRCRDVRNGAIFRKPLKCMDIRYQSKALYMIQIFIVII
jgi:hypothetical protein